MLLTVSDITISGKIFNCEVDERGLELEFTFLDTVYLEGKASKSGEDVLVSGRIETTLEVGCHRCLEPFPLEIESNFELFYQVYQAPSDEEWYEVSPEELGILYYKDNTIDLFLAVRDTILLEIPMKLVCSENCGGLCSMCGKNLNHNECQCQTSEQNRNPFKEFFQKTSET